MMNIAEMTHDIGALAPMPASVKRLSDAASKPDVSIGEIVEAVKFDQALTADLLRVANSAWSGAAREIDTVQAAIVRLGVARILGLATGKRLHNTMTGPCEAYHLGERELWRHSLAAAQAAAKIASFTSTPVPGSAFTAALLHDFGKLILARYHSAEVIGEITALAEKGQLYIEAERMVLGTDHAAVGGMAAKHWQFPQNLVNAIERHHEPDIDPNALQDAVHVANIVAKTLGIGLGSEQMNMEASADAPARLGLSSASMEALCAAVLVELPQTEALFEVK